MSETVTRLEDMSPDGRLQLHVQGCGDVVLSIYGPSKPDDMSEPYAFASVEFCTPGNGGGGSPKTFAALRALVEAMKEDNEDPFTQHRNPSPSTRPHQPARRRDG